MSLRSSEFKSFLQEELVLRCQRNPAYSLRSFAQSIGLSPSFLSKILNGQRRVTERVFRKVATNLNLEVTQINSFLENEDHVDSGLQPLQLEYFKIISDWYHFALIELTHVAGFQNSPEWIATRLGITVNQAKAATERLLQLELLELKDGKLKPTSGGNSTTKNEFTDLAFKKMQDELLHKSVHSLWHEDMNLRDHTSICMAIDPADLPEAKKRLAKMRRDLCRFLERPKRNSPKQVYNLSLSFFALSKEEPHE